MYDAWERHDVREVLKTLGTPSCEPLVTARDDHEKIYQMLQCRSSGLSEGRLEDMESEFDLLRAVVAALINVLHKRAALTTDEMVTIIAAGSEADLMGGG